MRRKPVSKVALLERETLTGVEVELIMNGEELPPAENKGENSTTGSASPAQDVGDSADADQDFELEESSEDHGSDEPPKD